MKIRPKILLAFAVPTAITLVITLVIFEALTESLRTSDRVRHTEQVIAGANELVKAAVDAETGERGFVITRAQRFLEPFTTGNATFARTAGRLRALVSDNPPQVARLDAAVALHQQWIGKAATPEIAAARTHGITTAARLITRGKGKALVDQLRSVMAAFIATEQGLLRTRTARSDSASARARIVLLAGVALMILVKLGIGLFLSKRLSDSAQEVTQAAKRLAEGDTTARAQVTGADEIAELGTAFNTMAGRLVEAADTERDLRRALQDAVRDYSDFAAKVAEGDLTATVATNGSQDLQTLSHNLNGMVAGLAEISGRVRDGVQSIRSSTSEILAAVSQHTQSANQQSAAISETSTTVDEIRATAEQTAQKAKEVAEQAKGSVQVSDEGNEAVASITQAMQQIREHVEAIARDILTLSEQTQQIGEITATVNDLADQSNILALNASIEASKAGEHGKGFAVVAAEVRNLAEQSKGATAQVSRILGDIQKATTAAVLATEQGTKVVEDGLQLTERAGDGIRSLADTIRGAAHAAQQIAAAAHQQSVGMDQIAEAIKDVSQSTAQFVAGAEQSQQAAADLNGLSSRLATLTERYQV